jgi:ABC-type amino acid transport substrate-binding protein
MTTTCSRLVSLLALVILAGLVSPSVVAAEIRTAAQEDSEPKYLNEGGKVVGLCIDIMRAIERLDPGLRFSGEQTWLPLMRLEHGVRNGKLDMACGFVRNREREAAFQIVLPRLFPVQYRLVVRAGDDPSVRSWDDVRKLGADGVILVNSGRGPARRLEEMGGLLIDSGGRTTANNLQKLASGRGRFFYYRTPGLTSELRRSGVKDKLRLLPVVLESQDFFMMLGKHVPQDRVERLSAAVRTLQDSGELARLLDKWDGY